AAPVVAALVAVVCGHLARSEIRREPDRLDGDGLAVARLVLGYANLALAAIGVLMAVPFCGGLVVLAGLGAGWGCGEFPGAAPAARPRRRARPWRDARRAGPCPRARAVAAGQAARATAAPRPRARVPQPRWPGRRAGQGRRP